MRIISLLISYICIFLLIFSSVYTCISASQDDIIWTHPITIGYHEDGSRISVTFYDIAIDDSGIYIVGSDESPGKGIDQWRIEKRDLVDGSLIWAQTSNPSNEDDIAYGVSVDSSGIYIVGYQGVNNNVDQRVRIEKRRLTDGSLIWAQTDNINSFLYQTAKGVTVDSSGLYLISYGRNEQRIQKRDTATGSLLWTQSNHASVNMKAGIAVDNSGVYIVGMGFWGVQKRNLEDGSIICNIPDNPDPSAGSIFDIAVDNSSIYLVGKNSEWMIEKRSINDGSLIWTQERTDNSLGRSLILRIAVDDSGLYIVGQSDFWRVQKSQLHKSVA